MIKVSKRIEILFKEINSVISLSLSLFSHSANISWESDICYAFLVSQFFYSLSQLFDSILILKLSQPLLFLHGNWYIPLCVPDITLIFCEIFSFYPKILRFCYFRDDRVTISFSHSHSKFWIISYLSWEFYFFLSLPPPKFPLVHLFSFLYHLWSH